MSTFDSRLLPQTVRFAVVGLVFVGCLLYVGQREWKIGTGDQSRAPPPAALPASLSPGRPKRVLVTGAAGFVGFTVAKELAQNPENLVVGLDNFNDYYDVQLKIDRAYHLHLLGVKMLKMDIRNESALQRLFQDSDFTHVVHLAAQAGVRYSIEKPLVYVESNLEGHETILNVINQFDNIHLTYASSSSVYGKLTPTPFRLSANTDQPGNMYAATKRADELLSLGHCHRTGLRGIGLRFFTVYGPWGRPDMAVYKFAESILDGRNVSLFHVSDTESLGRDFTYVDDIVSGVLSSMEYFPPACGTVYNLGFGRPVSVPGLISLLEAELDTKAHIEKLPLPPTEILHTWADIEESKADLNFHPKTDLANGVREFVTWFKEYRRTREAQDKSGETPASRQWYNSLVKES